MTLFSTTLVGNQPKIFEGTTRPGPVPNLRLARNRRDRDELTAEEYEQVVRRTIEWTIADQVDAGLDRVTDGRIRWDDPVTPFAAAHDGFEIGGLIRYFDNNVYYRRPTINGPIRFVRSAVADDFHLVCGLTDRPIMASVCGPYSLAKFCVDAHYHGSPSLFQDCARLVRGELDALAALGADWVQLDEPYLGRIPDECGLALDTIRNAVLGAQVNTFVYVYFTDISRIADRLWDLPVSAIGADCVTHPGNLSALLDGPKRMGRGFGIVDARTTRLETTEDLTRKLEKIAAADWPVCWITPSAALEFLPHPNAQAKMRRIASAVQLVAGVAVSASGGR